MTEPTEGRYGLRKRRRTQDQNSGHSGLDTLLTAASTATNIIVFSGSGLSATSGMSTFSTKNGLYERAQRKSKLQDGKTLFTYSFYDRHRAEAQAFFADIYLEAARAKAAPGHRALAALQRAGKLRRHYTLNIDGLAERVGMNTWHPEHNPQGCTVEMHGNVHHLVCVECGKSTPLTAATAKQLKEMRPIPCTMCPPLLPAVLRKPGAHSEGTEENSILATEPDAELIEENSSPQKEDEEEEEEEIVENKEQPPNMRFKVMLYEDAEGEFITPEEVMDLMEEDAKAADLILWVGISFQQSASTAYFRKVRHWLQEVERQEDVVQVVVNPSDEALWNLMTASSNQHELNVVEVLGKSDEVLPALVKHLAAVDPFGGEAGEAAAAAVEDEDEEIKEIEEEVPFLDDKDEMDGSLIEQNETGEAGEFKNRLVGEEVEDDAEEKQKEGLKQEFPQGNGGIFEVFQMQEREVAAEVAQVAPAPAAAP